MVNVVLDAKNQSFKLCSVDGVDVVSKSRLLVASSMLCEHRGVTVRGCSSQLFFLIKQWIQDTAYSNVTNTRFRIKRMRMKRKRKRLTFKK